MSIVKRIGQFGLATLGITCGLGLVSVESASAGITFTMEQAGVQNTTLKDVVVEEFESLTTGTFSNFELAGGIGTMNTAKIEGANRYGAAGGVGNYLRGGTTITLDEAQSYFGLWWSAGDGSNKLELFDENDVSLGEYSTSAVGDVIRALSPEEEAKYRGNPNEQFKGQNSREYYSYLNFFGTEGTKIKSIVLSGGNFESDNFAFSTKQQDTTGTLISGEHETVPEPASVLGLLAVTGLVTTVRRKASA